MKITYDEKIAKAPARTEETAGGVATLTRPEEPVEKKHLLTAAQMAHFVTYGFLKVEDLVPDELTKPSLKMKKNGWGLNSTSGICPKTFAKSSNYPR